MQKAENKVKVAESGVCGHNQKDVLLQFVFEKRSLAGRPIWRKGRNLKQKLRISRAPACQSCCLTTNRRCHIRRTLSSEREKDQMSTRNYKMSQQATKLYVDYYVDHSLPQSHHNHIERTRFI